MAVYLAYTGQQDMFLSENPEFTHFKTVYSRDMQSTSKIVEQPFDQTSYRPGDTLISTLKQNGEYIRNITIKLVLPKLTTTTSGWIWYTNPVLGEFVYGFDSVGNRVFTVQLNSRAPSTSTTTWYTVSTGVTLSLNTVTQKTTFVTGATSISYLVFSSFETARLFGFINNPVQLFSGFLRFDVNTTSPTSQVTFQECGWIPSSSSYSSYTDDTCYKLFNSISLYIGKQLIQEFDSNYIKIRKDVNNTYKNRPVLKLLEGDTNVVDFNRVYYFEVPFIDIPMYAIPRHDVQIRIVTNPLTNLPNFYASLVISFSLFSETTRLPQRYMIPFTQVQYFNRTRELDVRNPVKNMFTNGDPRFEFSINGERFFGSEKTIVDSIDESIVNVPRTSNVIVFDGPINMSRLRDQTWASSNTSVYAETMNVLAIENEMAGLLFDYTEVKGGYQKITESATVPQPSPTPDTLYLFDYIPATAANVVAIYSLRRTNIYYTGPVVRLRNVTTSQELDFYTDESQSYLRSLSNVNASSWTDPLIVTWYDQSGNAYHCYGGASSPILALQDGKFTIYVNNAIEGFTWSNSFMNINTNFTFLQNTSIIKPTTFYGFGFGEGVHVYDSIFSTRFVLNRITSTTGFLQWTPSATAFRTNNVASANFTLSAWSTITSYSASQGSNIRTIGTSKSIVTSGGYKGYMFELAFFNGSTLSGAEAFSYYERRPSGF